MKSKPKALARSGRHLVLPMHWLFGWVLLLQFHSKRTTEVPIASTRAINQSTEWIVLAHNGN
jgi:hypothetical protein